MKFEGIVIYHIRRCSFVETLEKYKSLNKTQIQSKNHKNSITKSKNLQILFLIQKIITIYVNVKSFFKKSKPCMVDLIINYEMNLFD